MQKKKKIQTKTNKQNQKPSLTEAQTRFHGLSYPNIGLLKLQTVMA